MTGKKYVELFPELELKDLDVNLKDMTDGRFTTLKKFIKSRTLQLDHVGQPVPSRWVYIRNELDDLRSKKVYKY